MSVFRDLIVSDAKRSWVGMLDMLASSIPFQVDNMPLLNLCSKSAIVGQGSQHERAGRCLFRRDTLIGAYFGIDPETISTSHLLDWHPSCTCSLTKNKHFAVLSRLPLAYHSGHKVKHEISSCCKTYGKCPPYKGPFCTWKCRRRREAPECLKVVLLDVLILRKAKSYGMLFCSK